MCVPRPPRPCSFSGIFSTSGVSRAPLSLWQINRTAAPHCHAVVAVRSHKPLIHLFFYSVNSGSGKTELRASECCLLTNVVRKAGVAEDPDEKSGFAARGTSPASFLFFRNHSTPGSSLNQTNTTFRHPSPKTTLIAKKTDLQQKTPPDKKKARLTIQTPHQCFRNSRKDRTGGGYE